MTSSKLNKTEASLNYLRRKDGLKLVLPSVPEFRKMSKKQKRFYQGQIQRYKNINSAPHKNSAWKKVEKVKWFDNLTNHSYVSQNDLKSCGVNSIHTIRQLVQQKQNTNLRKKYREEKEALWESKHKVLKQDFSDYMREKIGGFGARKEDLGSITEYGLIFGENNVDYTKANDQQLAETINAIDYYKPIEQNGVVVGYLDNRGMGRDGSAHMFEDMQDGRYIKAILKEAGLIK